MKKLFVLLILLGLFSCNNDDSLISLDNNSSNDIEISKRIQNRYIIIDGQDEVLRRNRTSFFINNQVEYDSLSIYTSSGELVSNSKVDYIYQNGYLQKKVYNTGNLADDRVFSYDSSGRIIEASLYSLTTGEVVYNYQFTYEDNGATVIFERLNEDNTVEKRHILTFDGDVLVTAGKDNDLDGANDFTNTFEFNEDGNMITSIMGTEEITYTYSDIINSDLFVANNVYGKKNSFIICAESYGGNSTNLNGLNHSLSITLDDFSNENNSIVENENGLYDYFETNTETVTVTGSALVRTEDVFLFAE